MMLIGIMAQCNKDGFTSNERKLIFSGSDQTKMPLYSITVKTDSLLLRTKTRPVQKNQIQSRTIQHLKKRMLATVIDSLNSGVGIAAPQVGIGINMIYIQRFDKQGKPFEVYFNPVITNYGDSINSGIEGCLSVPEFSGIVNRSQNITITYLDSTGSLQNENISGFNAVIFQHEIDHLNGVLYFDHISGGFHSLSKALEN